MRSDGRDPHRHGQPQPDFGPDKAAWPPCRAPPYRQKIGTKLDHEPAPQLFHMGDGGFIVALCSGQIGHFFGNLPQKGVCAIAQGRNAVGGGNLHHLL